MDEWNEPEALTLDLSIFPRAPLSLSPILALHPFTILSSTLAQALAWENTNVPFLHQGSGTRVFASRFQDQVPEYFFGVSFCFPTKYFFSSISGFSNIPFYESNLKIIEACGRA
jgi:hypothetical protein